MNLRITFLVHGLTSQKSLELSEAFPGKEEAGPKRNHTLETGGLIPPNNGSSLARWLLWHNRGKTLF
jgi:hypothetical protein